MDLEDLLVLVLHRHLVDRLDRRYQLDLVGLGGLFRLDLEDRQYQGYPVGQGYRRHLVGLVFQIRHQRLVGLVDRLDRLVLLVLLDLVDLGLHLDHRFLELHQLLFVLVDRLNLVDLVDLVDNHKLDLVLVLTF